MKFPTGIPDLDRILNGGVRPGTSIVAIGPFGAGYRTFVDTSAIIHGNWQAESTLFSGVYEDLQDQITKPNNVVMFSPNDGISKLKQRIRDCGDNEWTNSAIDHIDFRTLSDEVTKVGPVRITDDGTFEYRSTIDEYDEQYKQILRTFAKTVLENLSNDLLLVDAITDFLPIVYKYLNWTDLYFILKILAEKIHHSNSVMIAAADDELLNLRETGLLKRTFDVVLEFSWIGSGYHQGRNLRISNFPEYQRETKEGLQVNYEIEIDRGSFGLSKMQKIPPS